MFLAFKHRKLAFKSPLQTIPRKEGLHVALKGQWWGFRTFFKQLFWSEELGGRFQYSFIFTSTWGNDPIWFIFLLDGLKPPTTYELSFEEVRYCCFFFEWPLSKVQWRYRSDSDCHWSSGRSGCQFGGLKCSWESKVPTPMPPPKK